MRVLGFFLGAVLALAFMSAWMMLQSAGSLQGAWSAMTMPAHFKEAVFLSRSPDATAVYGIRGWQFAPLAESGVIRSSAISGPAGLSAIAFADLDRAFFEQDGVQLVEIPSSATGLASSPDGQKHAFMALAATTERAGKVADTNPSLWNVHVLNGGAIYPAGPGLAPFFIDDTHLGVIMPEGIMSLDLATGAYTQLLKKPFLKTITQTVLSEDRSLLAFYDPATGKIEAYRLGGTLEEVASIQSTDSNLIHIDAGAVYALRPAESGAEIWKHPFDGGAAARIHSLPKELRIIRISL